MSDSQKVDADTTAANGNGEVAAKDPEPLPPQKAAPAEKSSGLTSQLEDKIIRQVEYYFGDRNLPRDKFLQSAAAENEGGWVPIATLLTFNRLKALSSDSEVIVRALRKTTSGVLEVNNEGDSVRRSPDNPPPDIFSAEQRQKMKEKTVYVKGFDETTPLDDIQAFFEQFGQLEHVKMRRMPADKKFKGSVFAEFKEKKMSDSFLELTSIEFKGNELLKESKEAYYARKNEERKKEKVSKKEVEGAKEAGEEASADTASQVLTKGAVLFFKGAELSTSREDIKEEMQAHATVAFIDFARGDKQGHIRFEEEGSASKVQAGLKEAAGEEGPIKMCGAEVEIRVLEGKEEEEYWVKALDHKARSKRGGGRRGRGNRRGGRGRGGDRGDRGDRKRKHDVDDESPPAVKQQKQDGDGKISPKKSAAVAEEPSEA